MKKYRWFVALVVMVLVSLACQALTGDGNGGSPTPDEFPIPTQANDTTPSLPESPNGNDNGNPSLDSELFPTPSDAENLIKMGDDTVIFQTKMSLKDAMNFYRDAYGKQGYTERDQLTVTSDNTFSMVFDGHPSGKAIVVQGVDLGGGSTNITITLQDV